METAEAPVRRDRVEAGDDRLMRLANRRFVYALVARALAEEADEGFRKIFLDDHTACEIELADGGEGGLEGAYKLACEQIASCSDLNTLAGEYTRIFIGTGKLLTSPWESVYLSGKRVLFQPSVLEVRRSYREAGLVPARLHSVPDDFVGLEVDFMAKLADAAYAASTLGDESTCTLRLEQSKRFLDDHLLRWIGGFADEVLDQHGECFYASVLSMIASYCASDSALLSSGSAL